MGDALCVAFDASDVRLPPPYEASHVVLGLHVPGHTPRAVFVRPKGRAKETINVPAPGVVSRVAVRGAELCVRLWAPLCVMHEGESGPCGYTRATELGGGTVDLAALAKAGERGLRVTLTDRTVCDDELARNDVLRKRLPDAQRGSLWLSLCGFVVGDEKDAVDAGRGPDPALLRATGGGPARGVDVSLTTSRALAKERRDAALCEAVSSRMVDDLRADRVPASRPACRRMHVPRWFASRHAVPAAAFAALLPRLGPVQSEASRRTLEAWLQAALVLGTWDDERVARLVAALDAQMTRTDDTYDASAMAAGGRLLAEWLCTWSTACDYVGDAAAMGQEVERFMDALVSRCGDCEDLVKAALCAAFAMVTHVPRDGWTTGASASLVALRRRCVVVMLIGGATAPSASASRASADPGGSICHVYGAAVPRRLLRRWLNDDETWRRATHAQHADIEPVAPWESRMPVLLLEGTNWTVPLQAALWSYATPGDEAKRVRDAFARVEGWRSRLEKKFPALRKLGVQVRASWVLHRLPHHLLHGCFTTCFTKPSAPLR